MIALLIAFLIIIIFLAFFIGYNLSYVSTFWFFHTYTDVPVLVLVFFSFAAGMCVSILFFLAAKIKQGKNKKTEADKAEDKNTITTVTPENTDNSVNE